MHNAYFFRGIVIVLLSLSSQVKAMKKENNTDKNKDLPKISIDLANSQEDHDILEISIPKTIVLDLTDNDNTNNIIRNKCYYCLKETAVIELKDCNCTLCIPCKELNTNHCIACKTNITNKNEQEQLKNDLIYALQLEEEENNNQDQRNQLQYNFDYAYALQLQQENNN